MHLSRSSSMPHACHRFWKCSKAFTFCPLLTKVHDPLRLPRETNSEPPKVVRTPGDFNIFDFEVCFAPQRRALFPHLNFQTWREHVVFCTISLEMSHQINQKESDHTWQNTACFLSIPSCCTVKLLWKKRFSRLSAAINRNGESHTAGSCSTRRHSSTG